MTPRPAPTSLLFAAPLLALLALAAPPARAQDGAAPDEATLATLAFALASAPAAGQLPLGEAGPGAGGAPAIELSLEVSARELLFEVPPRVRPVSVTGPRRATWRVERVNLPAHVQAGVVYRDVAVRVFLVATPGAFEVLVADARKAAAGLRLTLSAAGPAGVAGGGAAGQGVP
jgi:hypothetical protein